MNGPEGSLSDDDDFSTIRGRGAVQEHSDEEEEWHSRGEYSSRMEEILSDDNGSGGDDDDDGDTFNYPNDEDEEEDFVYTGEDADTSHASYRDQLKEVLDGDSESDEDELSDKHFFSEDVSLGSIRPPPDVSFEVSSPPPASSSDMSASSSSAPRSADPPAQMAAPSRNGTTHAGAVRPPFLHPSISRLRSAPQSRTPSGLAVRTDVLSPSPSYLSSVSRSSSTSNPRASHSQLSKDDREQEPFRWTTLKIIGECLYNKRPEKANSILGTPSVGFPTVLAANGMICVGTDTGRVLVFDFRQNLKCICGDEAAVRPLGPVTALALSHDHTFIAVGHVFGHIQLFDLNAPQTPARSVPPTTTEAVASGRQEGHIVGSRITSIGFIAGRHTAIVSADDQGLAFYHSLGKVLFVDATDVLRILGKYPDATVASTPSQKRPAQNGSANPVSTPRKPTTILSMAHLPLGTAPNATDAYQIVALLTPIKLVIIGLKPTPKTWFRRHREGEEENDSQSKFLGCLAWFPSIAVPAAIEDDANKGKKKKAKSADPPSSNPLLAFTWDRTLTILSVYETRTVQKVVNKRTGMAEKVDSGKMSFKETSSFHLHNDILAIQWLNANQIILFSDLGLDVLDVKGMKVVESTQFDASMLVSPTLGSIQNGHIRYQDSVREIQHSIRSYKGKVFALGYSEVRVGTLLSWADKILAFVQEGDFLSAISLTREYFLGNARGNKNGLPEDPDVMRSVVGEKMSELMVASARYAFSDDRLTDDTHVTPDNRGVDRTSMFEDLVTTCARACVALNDFDFLFEELFQFYDNSGISSIYLHQLEPFVLDNSITFVPPRITKRLIAVHEGDGKLQDAERIIWHIDPACLDIDQAVTLCRRHSLYDALIYVYNTALNDFITPFVLLLGFVRSVQQRRRVPQYDDDGDDEMSGQASHTVQSAYRIYAYLSHVLSGMKYPGGSAMQVEDGQRAMDDIYGFLFYGRSKAWSVGDGSNLVLTSDEEGGPEPTYPYARLLLRFDAEAFLHTLDIAFEHSYLNDSQGVSRQIIVKILMDIVESPKNEFSSSDKSFIHIFIARNVPKYVQYIHISPSALQSLLTGLASDPDQSTREDRQLAVEFLLSAYTPRHGDEITELFEQAGFYRILRSWYRSERQWSSLINTFVRDEDMKSDELFANLETSMSDAARANRGTLPRDVLTTILDSVEQLLDTNIPRTALLIDQFSPENHTRVISSFPPDSSFKQFAYLRCLLGPPSTDDSGRQLARRGGPATQIDQSLRRQYIYLLCQYDVADAIDAVEYLPKDFLPEKEVAEILEHAKAYEAVVWLLNRSSPVSALERLESFSQILTSGMTEELSRLDGEKEEEESSALQAALRDVEQLYHRGISICRSASEHDMAAEVPLEDVWFKLLSSQIDSVQTIAALQSTNSAGKSTLEALRDLVQKSFTNLVSVSSTKAVSFPRLFKRLVDSSAQSRLNTGTPYNEFRSILTSMLESYRSEGDMLVMSKRILDNDFFDTMEALSIERGKGWMFNAHRCATCRQPFEKPKEESEVSAFSIVVSRTGFSYHSTCFSS